MAQLNCDCCGKEADDADRYCSACGCELQPGGRICTKCHQTNPDPAHFCMACGEDLAAQEMKAAAAAAIDHLANTAVIPLNEITEINTPLTPAAGKPKATQKAFFTAIGLILVLLAALGAANHYHQQQVAGRFISASSQLIEQMNASGQTLTGYLDMPINPLAIAAMQQAWPGQLQELQDSVDTWNSVACPEQYRVQQQSLARLAQIHLTVMGQIPEILAHPLAAASENHLESLRQDIEEAGRISEDLQLPGVQPPDTMPAAVAQERSSAYCAQQREIHKAKLARLETMEAYFKQMDSIIGRNNEAKTSLGAMLGKIRSGEYGWTDYFKMIDGARTTREALRTQVNRLITPAGAEEYTAELNRLLSLSINYCQLMKTGATSESKGDYENANRKYIEAQTLNEQIQSQYATFNDKYRTGKSFLSNIDNL